MLLALCAALLCTCTAIDDEQCDAMLFNVAQLCAGIMRLNGSPCHLRSLDVST